MPFADYETFDACVAANQDRDNPEAYCAFLQAESGEKEKEKVNMEEEIFENLVSGPLVIKSTHKQIVTAPVLVPGERDADDEVVTKEKIEEVALKYLEDFGIIDIGHTFNTVAVPVENWLTRNDETHTLPSGESIHLPAGTWMLSAKVKNQSVWDKVLKGELKGFSVTGVRKSDVLGAMKSEQPEAAMKSVIEAAMKRKTLLADLGPDWLAATVAMVGDPAVYKSKWLAIKSKVEEEGNTLKSLLKSIGDKLTGKSKEEEMKEEEVKAMVDAAIKEATDGFKELLKPLDSISEAVKSMEKVGERITAIETSLKEKADDGKGDDKDEGDDSKKDDEPSKEETALKEKVDGLAKEVEKLAKDSAPKTKAIEGDEDGDDDTANKSKGSKRDFYGRRVG